jgi:hypothetical protein
MTTLFLCLVIRRILAFRARTPRNEYAAVSVPALAAE